MSGHILSEVQGNDVCSVRQDEKQTAARLYNEHTSSRLRVLLAPGDRPRPETLRRRVSATRSRRSPCRSHWIAPGSRRAKSTAAAGQRRASRCRRSRSPRTCSRAASLNEETLAALRLPPEPIVTYTITPQDVAGPFIEKMPERHDGERPSCRRSDTRRRSRRSPKNFTAVRRCCASLNPGATWAAGRTIKVPDVEPFDLPSKARSLRRRRRRRAKAGSPRRQSRLRCETCGRSHRVGRDEVARWCATPRARC